RDCGRSTRIEGRPPTVAQLLTRRIEPLHYSLGDMASDAAGLLAGIGVQSAHVVGASMGGMIAQTLAAQRPVVVRSLVSIMSTTGNRRKGHPSPRVYRFLVGRAPQDRDAFVQYMVNVSDVIGSPGFPRDLARVRDVAVRSHERGLSPAGSGRQLGAILAAGDRTEQLRQITAPTLVIHGSADRMVHRSGGAATAQAIAGARLLMIDGLGHDLPRGAWPQVVGAIVSHVQAAERSGAGAPAG
ncbi:MAG: alpha/beta hydrolase, partial [Solirubrobacteraceae bacterium]